MIDKLKTQIIHWLGGHTEAEWCENISHSYDTGVLTMLYDLKTFADQLNGCSADDWCKQMYKRIEQGIKRREKGIH